MMSNHNEIDNNEDSKGENEIIQSVRNQNIIKLKLLNLSSDVTAKTPICRSSDDSVAPHILEMNRNLENIETVDNSMSLLKGNQSYFPAGAVLTRSKGKNLNDLKLPDISIQLPDISVANVRELQKQDTTLTRYWDLAKGIILRDKPYPDEFFIKNDMLYRRNFRTKGLMDKANSQFVVPKALIHLVLKTSHESVLGAHLGTKKTVDRILSCFWFPAIHTITNRFCRSCHICQLTVNQGSVPKAPMLISKLANQPFEFLAMDLIGEIVPPSSQGHRYILTIICVSSRYPEAIALKRIDTRAIIDALQNFFFRFGVPDRITTDNGGQFCSKQMEDFFKMLNIKHVKSTPYHAMSNGIIEAYNKSLKKSLKRLCIEKTKKWNLYLGPCLFAHRESRHESTGFSPNEVIFGRTLKGPNQILRQLLTNDSVEPEVKTTYQHVLDLRSRIQETCKIVKEELSKSQLKSKSQFDKKTKHRAFKVNQPVLLMLSSKSNKLEYLYRGPYLITKVVGLYDYEIQLENGKKQIFHINMLKEYFPRKSENFENFDLDQHPIIASAVANVVEDEINPEELSIRDDELIIHYNTRQKESYLNVNYNSELSQNKLKSAQKLVEKFKDIFSDVPSITNLIEHKIVLNSDVPVRSKPYPVPLHLMKELDKELDSMLEANIIEPSQAFYASPMVILKKPSGELRVCINYKNLNKISYFDSEGNAQRRQHF